MFGISFSELLLVGLVALLVLGPERLPGAARTAGLWIGRLKRSFNSIKTEIERELGADEIRRQLHNEHILSLEQEARKLIDPQGTQAQPSIHPPAAPGTTSPQPTTEPVPAPAAAPDAAPSPVSPESEGLAHEAPSVPAAPAMPSPSAPVTEPVARSPRPHQDSTPAP
jgi:sec-independent protein translocase protein TatB